MFFCFHKTSSGRPHSDQYSICRYYNIYEEKKHCYLYVDSYDFDSITINKNGNEAVQHTDEPYIYDLGVVTPEDEVIVIINVPESQYGYIDFYPYYVNEDALNEGYEILKSRQLNVTSFEETKITGTVSIDEDCLFYTSIPYDSGWTVKIDGKEIAEEDYVNLNEAYLCFNISAGEHEIEISFMPDGLVLGAGITVFTVIALIAAAFHFARIRRRMALVPDYTPPMPYIPKEEKEQENVSEPEEIPEEVLQFDLTEENKESVFNPPLYETITLQDHDSVIVLGED
mgnify:CR=1 FL=1